MVTISTALHWLEFCMLCNYDVKADKLPLETEPAAHDNDMVLTLKPGYQTSVVPYSNDHLVQGVLILVIDRSIDMFYAIESDDRSIKLYLEKALLIHFKEGVLKKVTVPIITL